MKRLAVAVLALLLIALVTTLYYGLREDAGPPPSSSAAASELVEKGAYLARAGDCVACHTTRGGVPFAGGRAIRTPFGTVYATNITPDKETGIGDWSADDFWRALHNGKSKGGKLLYPAFPYPNYTRITRADADALFAYLQSLPAVRQPNREAEMRFPFNLRPLLIGWRALYFRPGVFQPQGYRNAEWNRGAYLVQGLGHCNACHTPRNIFGATEESGELRGAMIPMLNWYASSLTGETDTGLGSWAIPQIAQLLKTGVSSRGAVSGPMAEVVRESLQYLSDDDIRAMALYLKRLPRGDEEPVLTADDEKTLKLGAALYDKHCVDCHKASGEGEPPAYPPLAGNRAVVLTSPVNPIHALLHGGYPPSTRGNPRPYGMPPFSNMLTDVEAAAVLSYIRHAWGNQASMVSAEQVNRYRAVPLE
ncbi:MAG TPA: cytochrome c [Noviherbaspirillum sp.]|nr:cytochrome c [Noviherbaspirillum sp.]